MHVLSHHACSGHGIGFVCKGQHRNGSWRRNPARIWNNGRDSTAPGNQQYVQNTSERQPMVFRSPALLSHFESLSKDSSKLDNMLHLAAG